MSDKEQRPLAPDRERLQAAFEATPAQLGAAAVRQALDQRYPYIRVWGALMGSFDYFIEAQQERAAALNAPGNAVFITVQPDHSVTISTTEDILAASTRLRFVQECERLGVTSPWAESHRAF